MQDLDEIENDAQDHMRLTVAKAISDMPLEMPEKTCIPAVNAGHLYGIADVLIHMVSLSTRGAGNPDFVAEKIANYIRSGVALETSEGRPQ